MYISYWILPLWLVLYQLRLFFCIFPGGRHCVLRVLKENRSRLMLETVLLFALAPQSCLLFFLYWLLLCERERERERERKSPKLLNTSLSSYKLFQYWQNHCAFKNRDLRAKCLPLNCKVHSMSRVHCSWNISAKFQQCCDVIVRNCLSLEGMVRSSCVGRLNDALLHLTRCVYGQVFVHTCRISFRYSNQTRYGAGSQCNRGKKSKSNDLERLYGR